MEEFDHYGREEIEPEMLQYCDLVIITSSAKTCFGHRSVFAQYSILFKELLADQKHLIRSFVHLPNYSYEDVQSLLQILYLGRETLSEEKRISLQKIMKELCFFEFIPPATLFEPNILTSGGFINQTALTSYNSDFSYIKLTRNEDINTEIKFESDGQIKEALVVEDAQSCQKLENYLIEEDITGYFGIAESNSLATDLPGFHFDSEPEAQVDAFSKEDSYFVNGCLDGRSTTQRRKGDSAVRRKTVKCSICNETLSGNKLSFHMKKYHNCNGKIFFCDYCSLVFVGRKDRDKHEEVHPTDLVECDICDLKVNRRKLNFHRNSMHFSEVKHFKCDICKEDVAVAHKYNHMRTHDECLTRFTCEKCGKIYYNQYSFQKHQDTEHGRKKMFSCHICKKTFDTSEERSAHSKTHKKRQKKQCPFCQTSVANVLFLQHIKRHAAHEIGNDVFQCPRCPRTFEKTDHTINHMVCHLDPPRPSECEFCFLPSKTAALTEKHSLREHIQEKKPKKKKTPREYKQCVKCGSHLISGEPYKRHLIDHAWNDVNVDQGDVNVTCAVCFRIFPCAMYLINHFLSHYETDRKHECERCFLSLPTTTLLAFHQSRCAGKRDYVIRKSTRQGKDKKQMAISSSVGTFAWLCSECSQMFETQEECEEHCSAMHTFEEIQC